MRWKSEGRLGPEDPGVIEFETLARALKVAIEIDQLHVSQLQCMEILCRAMQRIQLKYRDRFLGRSDIDSGGGKQKGRGRIHHYEQDYHFVLGTNSTRGLVAVCPALAEWLADKKHREVLMLKEDRKLNAERAYLAGGPSPDNKDKSKAGAGDH